MSAPAIPYFFLYGEPPQDAAVRFIHVETLAERSGPNGWIIRPHAHRDLHHVFHIISGGVQATFDGGAIRIAAPFVLLVPCGVVHSFVWEPGSDGHVLTVAEQYVRDQAGRDPLIAALWQAPSFFGVSDAEVEASGLSEAFARIGAEAAWEAPGREAALESWLVVLLVCVLRLSEGRKVEPALGPRAALVARFRNAVEQRFRRHLPIERYASELGVTPKQLRTACLNVAGKPPLQLVRQRLALEARRLLVYSSMTVAEVGFSLGFEDPAYFSRFCRAEIGSAPRRIRETWRRQRLSR
jgi:AraC family transcriptional activator of pobA